MGTCRRGTGAVVYVNDDPQGPIQAMRTVLIPPGVPVKLSIPAELAYGAATHMAKPRKR